MSEHIQFETNSVTVLAKKVPEGAINIHLKPHPINPDGLWIWYKVNTNTTGAPLPKGDWTVHCITPDVTEEQAIAITVEMGFGDYDYLEIQDRRETLDDLLRSHGIDPKQKNVLLIRKT